MIFRIVHSGSHLLNDLFQSQELHLAIEAFGWTNLYRIRVIAIELAMGGFLLKRRKFVFTAKKKMPPLASEWI